MRARLSGLEFGRADGAGLAVVLAATAAAIIFREATIVPRAFVGICASAHAPLICAPRQAVLWLQYEGWFGVAALVLGIVGFAFASRSIGVAALAIGIVATVNYNGTEGIIGVALGLWGWLEAASVSKGTQHHARQ